MDYIKNLKKPSANEIEKDISANDIEKDISANDVEKDKSASENCLEETDATDLMETPHIDLNMESIEIKNRIKEETNEIQIRTENLKEMLI